MLVGLGQKHLALYKTFIELNPGYKLKREKQLCLLTVVCNQEKGESTGSIHCGKPSIPLIALRGWNRELAQENYGLFDKSVEDLLDGLNAALIRVFASDANHRFLFF